MNLTGCFPFAVPITGAPAGVPITDAPPMSILDCSGAGSDMVDFDPRDFDPIDFG